jgi:hypothetical protein
MPSADWGVNFCRIALAAAATVVLAAILGLL